MPTTLADHLGLPDHRIIHTEPGPTNGDLYLMIAGPLHHPAVTLVHRFGTGDTAPTLYRLKGGNHATDR